MTFLGIGIYKFVIVLNIGNMEVEVSDEMEMLPHHTGPTERGIENSNEAAERALAGGDIYEDLYEQFDAIPNDENMTNLLVGVIRSHLADILSTENH